MQESAKNKTDCSNDGCEEHSRLKPRVRVEVLMIRNCCQSWGWARAPFISIPDCEAKSCAHQSQGLQSDSKWCQEVAAEI